MLALLTGCTTTEKRQNAVNTYNSSNLAQILLQYDINEYGKTENIKVLRSTHNGDFDKAAIESLSKWLYKPKKVDGKPFKQTGLTVQLEYNL
jgi:protein TonB